MNTMDFREVLLVGLTAIGFAPGVFAATSDAEEQPRESVQAQVLDPTSSVEAGGTTDSEPVLTKDDADISKQIGELTRPLLDEFQQLLDAQRIEIESQQRQLQAQQEEIDQQKQQMDAQTSVLGSMQQQLDELAQAVGAERESTPEELAMREQLTSLQNQLAEIPEDPTAAMAGAGFPGSIRVPGTDAAFKIGGYVKMNIVKSFDPVGSSDRFIVGSIPVEADDISITGSDTQLTADQTRLNFEMRKNSSVGQFRAFVEGDFASIEETFRLRHAYGQFRDLLAGKTWSVFYDPTAQPEEVDFEGINGVISLRQAQIRYFPRIGKNWELAVSLEDPESEVTVFGFDPTDPRGPQRAINDSNIPDLVASIRHKWFGAMTLRSAFVLRRLQSISSLDNSVSGSTTGFGLNVGGTIAIPAWNENDNLKFQLVAGRGIGRYINDTNSIGGQDAVFGPDDDLEALPILSGVAAFQHWWSPGLRSTLLYSFVNIDTFDYQPDSAYSKTQRASINLIWSPISRIDVGAELLWGQRTNKNDKTGTARQLQVQTKYRF